MSNGEIEVEANSADVGRELLSKDIEDFKDAHVETKDVSDPYEDLASSYGFKKGGERSAKEYIEYALKKLPKQKSEIDKLKIVLDELVAHNKKQDELALQKARTELEQNRLEAISRGNVEEVTKIEKKQSELSTQKQEVPSEVLAFKEKHASWLNGTSYEELEMQDFVKRRSEQLGAKDLSPAEHMRLLEDHVMKKFKDYFNRDEDSVETTKKETTQVDSSERSGTISPTKKRYTVKDLTSAQLMAARYLEQRGVMTLSDYIKQLVASGDLK